MGLCDTSYTGHTNEVVSSLLAFRAVVERLLLVTLFPLFSVEFPFSRLA